MQRTLESVVAALLVIVCGCGDLSQRASSYPNRPIKLVVPFAPGGGTDTFARIIKKAIEDDQLLPCPLVIVNLDGAGATIGSRRVKNARPDGYTILILHEAIVTAKYSGQAAYGPEAFAPIAGTGKMGLVIAVREDAPYRDLGDLLAAARQTPDTLVFAANLGAPVHFVGLRLEQEAPGATFRFTQSGGGTKRLHAVMGGHADVTAFSIEEYLRYEPAGVRALAYCDTQRHAGIPQVRTTHEQGIDLTHINMQFWWAPKDTPPQRLDVLADALERAMQTDYVRQRMARIHCDPVFVRGAPMQAEIEARRRSIAQVDLRQTQALPNVAALVLAAVSLLTAAVVAGRFTRRPAGQEPGADRAAPRPRYDLAVACGGATLVYALLLTLGWPGFRAATFVYVLLTGLLLTGGRPRHVLPLVCLAAALPLGVDLLLARVFDLDLP